MKTLNTLGKALAATCLISSTSFAEVDYYKGKSNGETCKVRVYKDFDDNITKVKVKGMADISIGGKYKFKKQWEVLLKADELSSQSYNLNTGITWKKTGQYSNIVHNIEIKMQAQRDDTSKIKNVIASDVWGVANLKTRRSIKCLDLQPLQFEQSL